MNIREQLTVTPILLCHLEIIEDVAYNKLEILEMQDWYDIESDEFYFGAESMTLLNIDTLEFTVLNEEHLLTVLEKLEVFLGEINVNP